MSGRTLLLTGLAAAYLSHVVGSAQSDSARVVQPLVLDVAGDGIQIVPPTSGVRFDLTGSGKPSLVAWTAAQSDDGFLAIDLNHNGRIDGGLELLGGAPSGTNGFEALRSFKAPPDHPWEIGQAIPPGSDRLLPTDDKFRDLLVWIDSNHNGISEDEELSSLAYSGVASILLGYEQVRVSLDEGGVLTLRGTAFLRDGHQGEVSRTIGAVALRVAPAP